jgi:gamma-glutamylcyclotransferase (GGCT)/AIG2-like uncharacterized protein YtfP
MTHAPRHLFVYGTLRSDCGIAHAVPGDATTAFAYLDAYEGCSAKQGHPHEFSRREIEVQLANGALQQAWAYLYQFPIGDCKRIISGDYLSADLLSADQRTD